MKQRTKILLLYLFCSLVWVVGSDLVLLAFDQEVMPLFQGMKGIVFVLVSSVFIYLLISKTEKLQESEEEKEKIDTLINSMVDFVNFKDGEGRWIQTNDYGLKLYQLENVDYRGKKDSELAAYSKASREPLLYCEHTDNLTWERGETTRTEEVFPMKDGTKKTFDTIKTPIYDENGKRKGLVVIGRDITERKKAEKQLAESELRYKALFDHNPELVYRIDLHGNIVDLNDKFMQVTGYKQEDALGKSILTYVQPNDHERLRWKLEQVKLTRKAHQCNQVRINHRYGDRVIVNCASVPIIIDNELVGITGYATNITKIIETEEKLRTTEKLAVVGELAAGIAHEIRNPLTSLRGFVQLFQDESKENNPLHRIMLDELERINTIASELLVLSRPQEVAFQRCNLRQVLGDVVQLMGTNSQLNGATLSLQAEEGLSLECDPNQLKQLFINVVKNAAESGASAIVVRAFPSGTQICVAVEDNGCGISADRIERLGEPFYSQKERGTGLGLTISHKIVEAHHGAIQYKSELGTGTTVFIALPKVQ
ncbi:PAS domain S-box protein [Bacillus sp. FSL W7-1321]